MTRGAVISMTLAVPIFLAGCGAGASPAKKSAAPAAVQTAAKSAEPDIQLRPIDRAGFDALLVFHPGKVVLVDFWATWCPPCRKQFKHSVELNRKYGPKGLVVISVRCDDAKDTDRVLAFLRDQGATFQNLRAVDGATEKTFEDFSIEGGAIPHYKLYDQKGKLHRTFASDPEAERQFSLDEIDAAVEELLEAGGGD